MVVAADRDGAGGGVDRQALDDQRIIHPEHIDAVAEALGDVAAIDQYLVAVGQSRAHGIALHPYGRELADVARAEAAEPLGVESDVGARPLSLWEDARTGAGAEADKAAAEKAIDEAKQALQEVRELSAVRQTQERNRDRLNDKPKKPRKPRAARGPTAEEIEQRFGEELIGYTMRSISAMQQLSTSAEEWAELELRNVELARERTLANIEADKHYSEAQKAELAAEVEQQAERERATVAFRKRARLEQEAEQLADERFRAQDEELQLQFDLAETQADRKRLALQILDAEDAYLRSKLEAVDASETASDVEKERARIALEALEATAGRRRERVEHGYETELQRYLRELDAPDKINAAMDRIKIEGLDSLNDGIVDAIMGAKSLGDVFDDVADQIIADLLRIFASKSKIRLSARKSVVVSSTASDSIAWMLFTRPTRPRRAATLSRSYCAVF